MLILKPSRHSCQHVNQTLKRATPKGIRNTPQRILLPHKVFWRHTLFSRIVIFVKEHNDDDVAQIFIDTLKKNMIDIYKTFKFPKSMIMTMHDKTAYDNSTVCHICNEELGKDRVRDHCHLSGKFWGAAHEVCKLKYKIPKVVFYNLSRYDSHLFIKKLGNSK